MPVVDGPLVRLTFNYIVIKSLVSFSPLLAKCTTARNFDIFDFEKIVQTKHMKFAVDFLWNAMNS